MSTKATIADGEDFHLYYEMFDPDSIYLELEGAKFDIYANSSHNQIQLCIPLRIWEAIRTKTVVDHPYKKSAPEV
jgi:hypothetical protein